MKPLRILVNGATAFLGSKALQTLSENFPGASIVNIGRRKASIQSSGLSNTEYISCDLLGDTFKTRLPGHADVIIHLAGDRRTFVSADDYTSQTYSNVIMTSNMADYAYSAKAALFIYASSVYVYSGNSSTPFYEHSVDIPGDILGATKLASECLLKARATAGQFKALAFRIGTVYGPGASPEQFIPQTIQKLQSPDPVAKFGNGGVKRDFIFVEDVACACTDALQLIEKDFIFEALNVGTDTPTSIQKVVQELADLIGTKKKVIFSNAGDAGNKADTNHQLDIAKIRSLLGWQPKVSLREGLRQTMESFRTI